MTTHSDSNKPVPSSGETGFTSWGCFIGIVVGLLVTLAFGRWWFNAMIAGIAGYIVGAFMDRSRR